MDSPKKIFLTLFCCILILNCASHVFGEDAPASDSESGGTDDSSVSGTASKEASLSDSSDSSAESTSLEEETATLESDSDYGTTSDDGSDPYYLYSASDNTAKSPIDLKTSSDVDLFTGSFSYYYPFNVPRGTNDLTPSVALSYSSSGSSGPAGFAGLGWDLGMNYIERDVKYTPDNLADDRFYLSLNGRNELIPPLPCVDIKPIVFSAARNHTNYPVLVHTYWNSSYSSDFSDVRFFATDNETVLNFYLENYSASTDAFFWVNASVITQGNTTQFYMCYVDVPSSSSNGNKTFLKFVTGSDAASWTCDFNLYAVNNQGNLNVYSLGANGVGCNYTFSSLPLSSSFISRMKAQITDSGMNLLTVGSGNNNWVFVDAFPDLNTHDNRFEIFTPGWAGKEVLYDDVPNYDWFIYKVDVNTSNSKTNHYYYNKSYSLLGVKTNFSYFNSTPSEFSYLWTGDGTEGVLQRCNISYQYIAIAKFENESFIYEEPKSNFSTGGYHTKIESYLYVEKKTGSTQNTKGDYWTVKDKDGTTYYFGYYNTSSLGSEVLCSGRNYVRRWYLDQIKDIHGNNITYRYQQNMDSNDVGTIYPYQITYNNDNRRIINFTLENRSDVSTKYEQGCLIRESKRLKEIQVKVDNNPIRNYVLNYTADPAARSMLSTITECNGTCLPATTFEYSTTDGDFVSPPMLYADLGYIRYTTEHADVNIDTFDINGDGFPDYVTAGDTSWSVYLNNGSNFSNSPIEWSVPDLVISGADQTEYIKRVVSGEVDRDTFDINGDGLPEYVMKDAGYWSVYTNTGNGFNTTPIIWSAADSFLGPIRVHTMGYSSKEVFDINGDGLPDWVTVNESGDWSVYLNNKSGFSAPIFTWSALGYISESDYTHEDGEGGVNRNTFDINGDGLPDYVVSENDTFWSVYLNTGNSFNTTPVVWSVPNLNTGLNEYIQDTDNNNVILDTFDINGDGLPDYIESAYTGYWAVFLNNGSGFNTSWVEWSMYNYVGREFIKDSSSHMVTKEPIDINGDGLLDYVVNEDEGYWSVYINSLISPALMIGVRNSLGGSAVINYTPSTGFDNTGLDNVSDLGFSMWVVSSISSNNGMSGVQNSTITTRYNHSGGFYDHQDKEFRGFNYALVNDSNGGYVEYYFHQDAARKGKLINSTSFSSSGVKYSQTTNGWGYTNSRRYYIVYLGGTNNSVFDGYSSPKNTSISYVYDSYGNVLNESYAGDTSVSGDEKYVVNTYVVNESAWVVGKIASSVLRNSTANVSRVYYFYDNHTGLNDTTGRGDLTVQVNWINSAVNATTLFAYYPLGLVRNTTDSEDRVTRYEYDSTYTYPVSVTNAKNQSVRSVYDLGTGNLLLSNDSNNISTTYEYDVFGRISKEIKPYDNSSSPTTNYTYYLDGVAPEGVKVSKKTNASESSIDVYTYVDGLARVIQTRRNAETANMIAEDILYDYKGRVDKNYVPYLGSNDGNYTTPAGTKYTQYTYDAVDRVIRVTNPDGTNRTANYDRWNSTYTDENSHKKSYYNDAYNRITQVDEVNGNEVYRTYYYYNTLDNLVKIIDNLGNNFSFGYDSLGRKTYMIDPDMGTWNYSYDKVGNLLSQKDNLNQTTNFTYDVLNRVTKADYLSDQDIIYVYDKDGGYTAGLIGTLTAVNDSAGTVRYYYDNRYRKTNESRVLDGITSRIDYTYDSADRIRTEKTPAGQLINYSYNRQGELNNISGVITNIDYNAQNKITSKTYANNVTTNLTYDSDSFRLKTILTKKSTTLLQNLSYTYDSVGNVESIMDAVEGKTQNFAYDSLDRLVSAIESGSYAQYFAYNSIGNILSLISNGTIYSYTYGQSAGPHAVTEKNTTNASCNGVKPIVFSAARNHTNYPVLVHTYWNSSCFTNFSDVRFRAADNVTQLNFYLENYSASTDAFFWVNVTSITQGNATQFYMYYNNSSASPSNGNKTFLKFITGSDASSFSCTRHSAVNDNGDLRVNSSTGSGDLCGLTFTAVNASSMVTRVKVPVISNSYVNVFLAGQNLNNRYLMWWLPFFSSNTSLEVIYNDSIGTYSSLYQYVPSNTYFVYRADWSNNRVNHYYYSSSYSLGGNLTNVTYPYGSPTTTSYIGIGDGTSDLNRKANISFHYIAFMKNENESLMYDEQLGGGLMGEMSLGDGLSLSMQDLEGKNYDSGDSIDDSYFFIDLENTTTTTLMDTTTTTVLDTTTTLLESTTTTTEVTTTTSLVEETTTTVSEDDSTTTTVADTTTTSTLPVNDSTTSTVVDTTTTTLLVNDTTTSSTTLESTTSTSSPTTTSSTLSEVDSPIKKKENKSSGVPFVLAAGSPPIFGLLWVILAFGLGLLACARAYSLVSRRFRTPKWVLKVMSLFMCLIILTSFSASVFASTYQYDANGNMVLDSEKSQCYLYNQANQLKEVNNCSGGTIAKYWYDYTGRRVITVEYNSSGGNTTTYYPFPDFETVMNGSQMLNTTYYFANGERVARRDPNGSMHYYSGDHLGSTSLVTDAAGNIEEKTRYLPFGDTLTHVGANLAKHLYTGQEKDTETGLYYYNARYYNPQLMRFTQPDTYVSNIYNPQDLNPYSYVQNNPLKYTDPTGHRSIIPPFGPGRQYYDEMDEGVDKATDVVLDVLDKSFFALRQKMFAKAAGMPEPPPFKENPYARAAVSGLIYGLLFRMPPSESAILLKIPKGGFSVRPEYAGEVYKEAGTVLKETSQLSSGTDYIFAETMDDVVKIGTRETVGSHPNLVGGANVKTAGHIILENGEYNLYPATGHYQVSQESITAAKDYLVKAGVDSSKIVIHTFEDYYTKYGGATT